MADLPAEGEILRENLAEEIRTLMATGAVTPQALKVVMQSAVDAAYTKTFQDCVKVSLDKERQAISIRIPDGLWPRRD